uniref:DnaJ heat shock protein family (Hsp40) member C17 n=1 Tax=Equus asinus TaxID=9793 RepID=A0A9L0KBT3_EQUAS
MAVAKELLQMDLYALLGIEEKAADKEVKKAYRQKALSCHPDKNPDNPRAAELFHQLSQALEVLTDAAARTWRPGSGRPRPMAVRRRRRAGAPGRLSKRLLSPTLQVEPPRDLYKVSQPGIGSAQNCHPPNPCSADRTPARRGFPAAAGAAAVDPGADPPGTGAEVERKARKS